MSIQIHMLTCLSFSPKCSSINHPGRVGARGQRPQVKGQEASLSTDEISRIMDMPAVTELLFQEPCKCKSFLEGREKRDGGRRAGHIQDE